MRKRTILQILIVLLACSCSSEPKITLQVSNPSNQPRNDASILLSRGEISGWITLPESQLPFIKDQVGDPVPCQLDDLDGDGNWDELFGLMDLGPLASEKITIEFISPEEYPTFPARTNLHVGDARDNYREMKEAQRLEGVSYDNYVNVTDASFQMEGAAWENDMVGFRNYLDQRNGMDIFGKTTTEMVLDNVGKEGEPSYHEPAGWGMDILKVGTSLGAGGIGYMYKDSIYRVGDNGSGTYRVQFEGSQRSRFTLSYTNWKVGELSLAVDHRIEITGGRRYYQGWVSYTGTKESLALVPGIVNMKSNELHVLELGEYTALYTQDYQAEDTTLLCMALMVPTGRMITYGETRDSGEGVIQTYYAVLEASPGEPVPYRFYSLWEKEDPRWKSLEEIEAFLKTEAERWVQSVVYDTGK